MEVGREVDRRETEDFESRITSKAVAYGLSFVSIGGAVCVLAWIIIYSRYGFDFTDESYYLVWVAAPEIYEWSLSQFGFVYHPFYMLFGGDVYRLRVFNICMTFAFSWFLVDLVIRDSFFGCVKDSIKRISISFGFAVGGLAYFNIWLVSPSYNSLNLQALLIVAAGLFMAQGRISRESIIGWLLIGVGGWLVFMAKPSSAAAMGVIAFIYLLLSSKVNIKMITLCALLLVALLLASALLIDGSLTVFETRLQTALAFLNYLGGGHSLKEIFRVDAFSVSKRDFIIFIFLLAMSLIVIGLLRSNNKVRQSIGLCLIGLAMVGMCGMLVGRVFLTSKYNEFNGLLMFVVPATVLLLSICFCWRDVISNLSRQRILTTLLFLLLPHVYAFGTNNNYWQVGGSAGFFWLLAGLVFIAPALRGRKAIYTFLPLVILTQFIIVILVQRGMELPYRQPQPLRLNSHAVEIGSNSSNLVLSEGYATYLDNAIRVSGLAGFKSGTPVIDLTGQSPGILYAIGATSIGQAWTIGGYPGSFKLADEALKKVSCAQLALAWILTEVGGPISISDDMLSTFGSSRSNYVSVGSWATAKGAGGYAERPRQALLKPLNSDDISSSCSEGRRASVVVND